MLTHGSLCTGIGGIDLGFARAGIVTRWQCEINWFCDLVLERHWDVPNHGDIIDVDWDDVEPVDIVSAGYPCQPFSHAGLRLGERDDRHLWPHVYNALRILRPRLIVLENVEGHLSLGMDRVLGDLAEIGYDAEWEVVSACSVGAPHRRRRVFIVAYPHGDEQPVSVSGTKGGATSADTLGTCGVYPRNGWWVSEPTVDRVADGVPSGLVRDSLSALSNSVVPQVAEVIGRYVCALAQG